MPCPLRHPPIDPFEQHGELRLAYRHPAIRWRRPDKATALESFGEKAHNGTSVNTGIFLEERDDKGNLLGIKGIGELGICGAGAAVANAVYNATGIRVREFPITRELPLVAI